MARTMTGSTPQSSWKRLDSFFPIVLAGYATPYVQVRFSGTFKLVAAISSFAPQSFMAGETTLFTANSANSPYASASPPLGSATVSPTDKIYGTGATATFACAGYGGTIPRGLTLYPFAVYISTASDYTIFSPESTVSIYYVLIGMAAHSISGLNPGRIQLKDSLGNIWESIDIYLSATSPSLITPTRISFMATGNSPLGTLNSGQSLRINSGIYRTYVAGIILYG
jgi:hypothetical protein